MATPIEELAERILQAHDVLLEHKIEANTVVLNGKKYGVLIKPGYSPSIFGMSVEYAPLKDGYDFIVMRREPKTNADRIRSMSDEELAKAMRGCPDSADKCRGGECADCWLDWLREEAKDG